MALTTAQSQAIKAAILADPTLAAMTSGPGTDFGAIANAMNLAASPAFVVWRTLVTREEIQGDDAFDYAQVDNLTNGSKYRVWEWMFANTATAINPSKPNIRAGIAATWFGSAGLLAVQAVVLARCKRNASRAEKACATGTGTTQTPALLTFEGDVSLADIAAMFLP